MKRIIVEIASTVFVLSAIFAVSAMATYAKSSIDDAFNHSVQSNGRIEYDYEDDGNLSGQNDVVIDADDIKALEKKSEIALYGNFVPDTNSDGTGTLYIRMGENPIQGE